MARQVVSRSQRRMEKRQALLLLVLVLAVSLVSFTLGVMVGRGGSQQTALASAPETPARVPVKRSGVPDQQEEPPAQTREKLTFYDSLPKGEPSPLGSGINLPPEEKVEDKTAAPAEKTAPKVAQEATREPAKTAAPAPPVSEKGAYAIQVASFRGEEDARKLKERLAGKRYTAFVEAADLQEKGVWHRVFVGPYGDAGDAEKVVARLQAEEKLTGLVRKR